MKIKFNEFLKINKTKINDELSKQATLIYQFGMKVTTAKMEFEKTSNQLELVEAKLSNHFRVKYKQVKGALSETYIRDLVKTNMEVIELKESLHQLKIVLSFSKIKLDALHVKTDMLITLANNIRQETKTINTQITPVRRDHE